jgi:hypothetical protein
VTLPWLRSRAGRADMARHPIQMPGDVHSLLDVYSAGRAGPQSRARFTRAQIDQIARTVQRTPEVMVKVTGGGITVGAVSAHLAYISQKGKLPVLTDEGDRLEDREERRWLLSRWHLELSPGQYRIARDGQRPDRAPKLVHNIVLSMPAPTPPDKVLAAARTFAREKFALKHSYAMVLHTHQHHPHVHLVVKAEGLDGRRLHIDKEMLRQWREDFARYMREQGVPANATSRAMRGRNKAVKNGYMYGVHRRRDSYVLRERVIDIAKELKETGRVQDPTRAKLVEDRKIILASWEKVAKQLHAQGEIKLAGEVRDFAKRLPPIRTERERLALMFVEHLRTHGRRPEPPRRQTEDLTR